MDIGAAAVMTLPGIEKTLGVCGGAACIVRTRIPVWLLESFRRLGSSEAEILDNYPTLRAGDLVHAWAYVDTHRQEIDDAIRQNETSVKGDLIRTRSDRRVD